jgi:hypothetical protein
MEKAHWLSRKRASLKLAKAAASSEARLVHYDLAGRYSLKALSVETQATDLADALPRATTAGGADPSRNEANDA